MEKLYMFECVCLPGSFWMLNTFLLSPSFAEGVFDKEFWMEGGEKLNIFWYGDDDRGKYVSLRCFVER